MRVDHERPSSRVGDDDAVVDAEVVDRQAGDLPGAHGHCAAERRAQREMRRARDLLADARRVPPGHAVLPTHTQVAPIHADTRRVPTRHAVPPAHTQVAPILPIHRPRHAVLPTDRDTGR